MKKIILPQLEILQIPYKNRIYYGASQEFYQQRLQRISGCGPTAITNQLAYMGKTQSYYQPLFPFSEISHETLLSFMNVLWNYVTPGFQGVHRLDVLAEGGVNYGRSIDFPLNAQIFPVNPKTDPPDVTKARNWLESQLIHQRPVAFLNLSSGNVLNLQGWHWVLLVGIQFDETNLSALIYDEGNWRWVDLKKWLETTTLSGGFVSFQ